MNFVSYAQAADQSGGGVMMVVLFFGVAVVVFVMGLLVVGMARKRGHRQAEIILGAVVVWGLVTVVSVVWSGMERMKWEKDQALLLSTGYLDPESAAREPGWPVGILVGMGVVYVGLVGFAMSQRNVGGENSESVNE